MSTAPDLPPSAPVHVAAAVLVQGGKMLIARRRRGELAGVWEFPGGKIEASETPEACLAREIREELSLDIVVGTAITIARHTYPHRAIVLHAFLVEDFRGEPVLVDHDAIAWVTPEEIGHYRLAPADLPVIEEILRRGLLRR